MPDFKTTYHIDISDYNGKEIINKLNKQLIDIEPLKKLIDDNLPIVRSLKSVLREYINLKKDIETLNTHTGKPTINAQDSLYLSSIYKTRTTTLIKQLEPSVEKLTIANVFINNINKRFKQNIDDLNKTLTELLEINECSEKTQQLIEFFTEVIAKEKSKNTVLVPINESIHNLLNSYNASINKSLSIFENGKLIKTAHEYDFSGCLKKVKRINIKNNLLFITSLGSPVISIGLLLSKINGGYLSDFISIIGVVILSILIITSYICVFFYTISLFIERKFDIEFKVFLTYLAIPVLFYLYSSELPILDIEMHSIWVYGFLILAIILMIITVQTLDKREVYIRVYSLLNTKIPNLIKNNNYDDSSKNIES